MTSTLLIDIHPAIGGHGQRGIGRYVRGLTESICLFPDDLIELIWAVGSLNPILDRFGPRGVALDPHRWSNRIPRWVTGPIDLAAALHKSGARALHATDPQSPYYRRGIPTLVTVYDLIPLRERQLLHSWRLDHRIVYGRYIRQIEGAARIVAISRATATDLQNYLRIEPDRIDIVYPAVALPEKLGRSEPPEPTFLVVGALDAHKQPELALRAFAIFRTRWGAGTLRYIGPSDPSQARRLHQLAADLGVSNFIVTDGRIPDEDLEKAYAGATALLSTSKIEGFGLPPVEAVLRGVPVIAVKTPAATETLEGAAAIVLPDAEAIADAMAHPMEPSKLVVAAMRERYSNATVARSLADAYRRVLF